MKSSKVEFVVYGKDNIARVVVEDKQQAMSIARLISGKVCKRITTIEEYEALDNDCTVWA